MLDRTKAPDIQLIGDLILPAINEKKLDNGIVLRSFSNGSQPVNQLVLAWRGGTCETSCNATATLASELLLEGTGSRTGAQISEELDFRGAMVKIYAREHYTVLTASCLNSMSAGLLPILRDIILDPAYHPRMVDNYKMRESMALEQNSKRVKWLADAKSTQLIMGPKHPCARIPTQEDIMATSREAIVEFQRRISHSRGCQAFLSGQLTHELVHETKKFLESLPQNEPELHLNLMDFAPLAPQTVKIDKPDALQSAISVALPAPKRSHPDYIPLRYTVIALGGYFGSRLMKNIREDKGYTYGIYSYLLGNSDGSYISIGAEADNGYVQSVIKEIENELRKMLTEAVEGDELLRLKQYLASKLVDVLESPFNIMAQYQMSFLVGTPLDYFQQSVEMLKRLDSKMIKTMAEKYLLPDQMRLVVAGGKI